MPTYSKPQHQKDLGNIRITPKPFWRRFFKLAPYYVGDVVEFVLHIDNPQKEWHLYERIGDDVLPIKVNLEVEDKITGRVINDEANIEYRLGTSSKPGGITLLTAKVWHKDTFVAQWFWIIVGAIITLMCTILGVALALLSGLIEINPEWILIFK